MIARSALPVVILACSFCADALAQGKQRVAVSPNSTKPARIVGGRPVFIDSDCADSDVIGAPDSTDAIVQWTDPAVIVVRRFEDGRISGEQNWSDVGGTKDAWIEFYGASDLVGRVAIMARARNPKPNVDYDVIFRERVIGGRQQEKLDDALRDRFRAWRPVERAFEEFRSGFSGFASNSPISQLLRSVSQRVTWVGQGEAPDADKWMTVPTDVRNFLRSAIASDDPTSTHLNAVVWSGRMTSEKREALSKQLGIELSPNDPPEALVEAALVVHRQWFAQFRAISDEVEHGRRRLAAVKPPREVVRVLQAWYNAAIGGSEQVTTSYLKDIDFRAEDTKDIEARVAHGEPLSWRDVRTVEECEGHLSELQSVWEVHYRDIFGVHSEFAQVDRVERLLAADHDRFLAVVRRHAELLEHALETMPDPARLALANWCETHSLSEGEVHWFLAALAHPSCRDALRSLAWSDLDAILGNVVAVEMQEGKPAFVLTDGGRAPLSIREAAELDDLPYGWNDLTANRWIVDLSGLAVEEQAITRSEVAQFAEQHKKEVILITGAKGWQERLLSLCTTATESAAQIAVLCDAASISTLPDGQKVLSFVKRQAGSGFEGKRFVVLVGEAGGAADPSEGLIRDAKAGKFKDAIIIDGLCNFDPVKRQEFAHAALLHGAERVETASGQVKVVPFVMGVELLLNGLAVDAQMPIVAQLSRALKAALERGEIGASHELIGVEDRIKPLQKECEKNEHVFQRQVNAYVPGCDRPTRCFEFRGTARPASRRAA